MQNFKLNMSIYVADNSIKCISLSICSNNRIRKIEATSIYISICFRCCKECAKTEGEPCGGELGFSGTCEPGLSCQQPGPTPTEGICRPILLEDVENTWNTPNSACVSTFSPKFSISEIALPIRVEPENKIKCYGCTDKLKITYLGDDWFDNVEYVLLL